MTGVTAAPGPTGTPGTDSTTGWVDGAVEVACSGCGATVARAVAFPSRCPAARHGDDIDHVLVRRIDPAMVRLAADDDPNPFVRYRQLQGSWHRARAVGWSDERYVGVVRRLDHAVAAIDGHGFRITPFGRADVLSAALGFSADGGVWVKDETVGVAGSHKARHLMGVMLELIVAEAIDPSLEGRPLAIASCGNAALAAAVVARAAGRRLDVFVPPDADPVIIARLRDLAARVAFAPRRTGERGDPTVARLHAAMDAGAIGFTCQGPDDGLAIEGGATIGHEIAEAMARDDLRLDRILVQVGGGALASACALGLQEAAALGVIRRPMRLDTVQTESAWPLRRAYERVVESLRAEAPTLDPAAGPLDVDDPRTRAVLDAAAHHRSAYMWPWETEPRSIAHGILDDETYDWLAVVRAMLRTGGRPVVVSEATLLDANDLAARTTGTAADETGTAGLAGLAHLLDHRHVRPDECVAVLFTGIRRGGPTHDRSER